MKHPYLKTLLLCLCMFASINAFAEAVEIDGIYYNLVTKIKEAEVTSNPNGYTGAIKIPGTVSYNGVIYSVTSIGDYTFKSCKGLTSVTIGNSVKSIGSSAFYECRGLTSVTIPNSVTSIGVLAFRGCTGLTSITIPNSVTSIESHTFNDCYGLTSVTIPNSVKSIGERAFYGCYGLTSVTIGNSVTSIGSKAFESCNSLKKVIVPDIAAWCGIAFDGYDSNPLFYAKHLYSDVTNEITNLIIPNSVTNIGDDAFRGCSGLTSVTIPNSVTSIGDRTFYDCSGLTSVTIPNSVTSIGIATFKSCSGLTSVTIPNSVTSIGNSAFYGCSGLTSVNIPNSVTSIGTSVFCGCSSLTSITIPNSVTSIESHTFDGCSGLTSVTIPNSVTSIRNDAFRYCSGLTSVTIPNSVTSIQSYAFESCSRLTSVNIGNSVENIGAKAFAYCAELTDVYCYAESVPTTQSDAFVDSYIDYATLHVPAASVEQYKATAPWSNFGTIVATDGTIPEPPTPKKCATPTISYSKGELTFSCETEDAEFVSKITDADIKDYFTSSISLSVTYNISVYATKADYENSDTIQATLCWIEQQPQTEGITDEDAIAEVQAVPVLIQTQGNTITVEGAEAGTEIILYGANGVQLDSVIATTGTASLNASRLSGSVAIVKIGNKTVKVLVKL